MMAPQCLLHTYLNVADAHQVMIFGLEEAVYEDKLTGGDELRPEDMPAIQFRGETDRDIEAHHEKRARSPCGPRACGWSSGRCWLKDGTVVMGDRGGRCHLEPARQQGQGHGRL